VEKSVLYEIFVQCLVGVWVISSASAGSRAARELGFVIGTDVGGPAPLEADEEPLATRTK
jgi:hypothetical protein